MARSTFRRRGTKATQAQITAFGTRRNLDRVVAVLLAALHRGLARG